MNDTTTLLIEVESSVLQRMKHRVVTPLYETENLEALIAFKNQDDAKKYATLLSTVMRGRPHVYKPLSLEAIVYPMLEQIENAQINLLELFHGEYWTVREIWFGKHYKD